MRRFPAWPSSIVGCRIRPTNDGSAIWLDRGCRRRIARDAEKVAAAKADVLAERAELSLRLAKMCGYSAKQWAARTRKIQARVESISDAVNRRHEAAAAEPETPGDSWAVRTHRLLLEDPPSPRIVVKEELAAHVVAEDVSAAVVAEIESHSDRYPGVKIVELTRRTYPQGSLAAHVLGHLGPRERGIRWGRHSCLPSGRQECLPHPSDPETNSSADRASSVSTRPQLQSHPGVAVEQTDRGGHRVASYHSREPVAGRDVQLTLDVSLAAHGRGVAGKCPAALGRSLRRKSCSGTLFWRGDRGHGCARRGDSRGRVGADVRSECCLHAAAATNWPP